MTSLVYELQDISFSFKKLSVFSGLNLSFMPGRFYGIVGPNGAGKTTLLDILSGFRRIDSGRILLNSKELYSYSKNELARLVSLIPQDYRISFDFTVEEILLMGRYPYIGRFNRPTTDDLSILYDVVKKLNLEDILFKYVTELSGGERQRVVFARTLIQNTPVILVDEGTANLDIYYTLELMDILSDKVKSFNNTVIACMHDINLACQYCDFLIYLKDGQVVCFDSIDRIVNEVNIKRVFGVNSTIYHEKTSGKKYIFFLGGNRCDKK